MMRTTITIDDALWEKVESYFGGEERNALIRKALQEMIQREAGRRLAALGGTDPVAFAAPRKRPWSDDATQE
jgi:metal-responsive CopG/Arc/MetJ family transcriptional regulator